MPFPTWVHWGAMAASRVRRRAGAGLPQSPPHRCMRLAGARPRCAKRGRQARITSHPRPLAPAGPGHCLDGHPARMPGWGPVRGSVVRSCGPFRQGEIPDLYRNRAGHERSWIPFRCVLADAPFPRSAARPGPRRGVRLPRAPLLMSAAPEALRRSAACARFWPHRSGGLRPGSAALPARVCRRRSSAAAVRSYAAGQSRAVRARGETPAGPSLQGWEEGRPSRLGAEEARRSGLRRGREARPVPPSLRGKAAANGCPARLPKSCPLVNRKQEDPAAPRPRMRLYGRSAVRLARMSAANGSVNPCSRGAAATCA